MNIHCSKSTLDHMSYGIRLWGSYYRINDIAEHFGIFQTAFQTALESNDMETELIRIASQFSYMKYDNRQLQHRSWKYS